MRFPTRLYVVLLVLLSFLAGCGETSDPSVFDAEGTSVPPLGTNADIFDGTSQDEGANPHFFFLPPISPTTPTFSGVADGDLQPEAVVCPIDFWNPADEACSAPLVTFSTDAAASGETISVDSGSKYHVVWRTDDYPVVAGQVYRLAISVLGRSLGYADIKAFTNQEYSGHNNTDPDFVAISDQGSLNINFRIEDGALESEYCDSQNLEDCDVEIFEYDEAGCLRVFENPGGGNSLLGSRACVPANAAELDGDPVDEAYAVILTLEKDANFQGTGSTDWQVPFFPDLKTDPPGISFNEASAGVDVVICQDPDGTGALPEEIHPFLRPFAIFSDGSVVLPEDFTYGVPECEGFQPSHHAAASGLGEEATRSGFRGALHRFAGGVSRVARFLGPRPLHAFRRLHGGLNTTVYKTRGDTDTGDGGGENVAAMSVVTMTTGDEFVVEFGAVLDVDAFSSTASVPEFGTVGSEVTILVTALNVELEEFPFEVPVEIQVSGANTETLPGEWLGGGVYQAAYTPSAPGTDDVLILIDGDAVPGSYSIDIQPVGASAEFTTFDVSPSEAGAATSVTVTVLDGNQQPYVDGGAYPIDVVIEVSEAGSGTLIASVIAEDDDGTGTFDGTYVGGYTPEDYGDFAVSVTVGGDPTGDSPQIITTAPRPADPTGSSVSGPDGVVDSPTTVSVSVVNTAGETYDYGDVRPISVLISVTGANSTSFSATDPDLDGVYQGTYTPVSSGTDVLSATIDGVPVAGTDESEVAPLSGDLVVTVQLTGDAPVDGLPVYLYQGEGPAPFMTATTDGLGSVTFVDVDFGDYTVHLPKRDFDMTFPSMTVTHTHDEAPSSVTISGITEYLPDDTRIWRVRDGGSGNAFRYIVGGRSWTSAQNQVRDDVLLGVNGHLATVTDAAENAFVASFFTLSPDLCPNVTNPKKCKYQGWLGLTDEDQEGVFEWVTGEPVVFFSWPGGEEPVDRKGNLDHVEIDLNGTWSLVNGASSTNEGYFVEWEVSWPSTPPF